MKEIPVWKMPVQKWICEHCYKEHSFKSSLLSHLETCKGKSKINIGCPNCGKRFFGNNCKVALKKHMESTCREKGKVTIDKSFFCEKQSLFCPFCNFKFVTLGGMTSHIKSAHGTKEPHEKANKASENSIEKTDEIASTIAEEKSIPQPKVPEKSANHDTEQSNTSSQMEVFTKELEIISTEECIEKRLGEKINEKEQKCPICKKNFTSGQNMDKHISLCEKRIAWKKDLKEKKMAWKKMTK